MSKVDAPAGKKFTCGHVELAFDDRAALVHLTAPTRREPQQGAADHSRGMQPQPQPQPQPPHPQPSQPPHPHPEARGEHAAASWASAANPLGLYQYQTFTNEDYNVFLDDFAIRIAGGDCHYRRDSTDDKGCSGFRKPNVTAAAPIRRNLTPTLTTLWASPDTCSFVAEATLPNDAHVLAGAPSKVVIAVSVSGTSLSWDVVQVDKTPTRLPEASFFSFVPAVPDAKGWTFNVLGSVMDPTDVVAAAGVYGGSPHLRGIESASYSGSATASNRSSAAGAGAGAPAAEKNAAIAAAAGAATASFTLSSLDVPIVSAGIASPFVTPRTEAPDMLGGVHYNIHQNIWNTNYILWYPYDGVEKHVRSRFQLDLHA